MVSAHTTSRDNEILTQFPGPPGSVRKALELLQVLRRGDADEMAEYGDPSNLPRPWDRPRARRICGPQRGVGATTSPSGSTTSTRGGRRR
jgi:hypothetical protein